MQTIRRLAYYPLEFTLERRYGDANGLKGQRRTILIEIETADGVVGWGETFANSVTGDAMKAAADLVAGADALAARPLVERIRPISHRLAAGIEIALSDIRGKVAGLPLVTLLGGACRAAQPAYASLQNVCEAADVTAATVEEATRAIGRGYGSLKMKIGWHDPRTDLAWIEAVLDALPEKVLLAIDANRALDMPAAKQVLRGLKRPERIMWFEEPLSRAWPKPYAELRGVSDIAIAGAESMDGAMIDQVVVDRMMDIINPDLVGHGGLAPLTRMQALCDTFGVRLVPHVFDGQLVRLATLHFLAAQPSWGERQSAFAAAPLECDVSPNPLRDDLFDWAPRPDADGLIPVPTAPGLGVEVDRKLLEKYATRR